MAGDRRGPRAVDRRDRREGDHRVERLVGFALAAGAIVYVFTPYTGGFNFFSGLRFLDPVLVVGAVVLVTLLPATIRWRRALLGVALALVIVNATMPNRERVPAWPGGAVLPTAVVVAMTIAVAVVSRRWRILAAVLAAGVAIVGGWFVQRGFLQHRYVDVGLVNDPLDAYFRDVHGASVVVAGTDDTYPMFGSDLSNHVRRADDPTFDVSSCSEWRVDLDGADFVAAATVTFGYYPRPPDSVFEDPAASLVLREGETVIYRLTGRSTWPRARPAISRLLKSVTVRAG